LTFLAGATKPVQRAARPLLRPDAPKLCATCHGFDALRLHLNYHRHP
jgi:hypothetical protein